MGSASRQQKQKQRADEIHRQIDELIKGEMKSKSPDKLPGETPREFTDRRAREEWERKKRR